MELHECIATYMRANGVKQAYIADKCKWSKQKTSDIIRGKQRLSAADMAKVCKALNVHYDFFYNMADDVGIAERKEVQLETD